MEPTNKQTKQPSEDNDGQLQLKQASSKPGAKRGVKKGSKINATIRVEDWRLACEKLRSLVTKMSQVAFLRSPISGELFDGGQSQCASFGKWLVW